MTRTCVCFECGKRWVATGRDRDSLVRAILAGHRRAQPFCPEVGDPVTVAEELLLGEAA